MARLHHQFVKFVITGAVGCDAALGGRLVPMVLAAQLGAAAIVGLLNGDGRRLQRATPVRGAVRRDALALSDRLCVSGRLLGVFGGVGDGHAGLRRIAA
jgi:hypothetical protein